MISRGGLLAAGAALMALPLAIVLMVAGTATGVPIGAPGSLVANIGVPSNSGSAPLVHVSGNLATRTGWAAALLKGVAAPQTSCNMNAVLEWMTREGGGFGNQASFNPLNLNPGARAGWPGHPATGAWAFDNPQDGLDYTTTTLRNYGGIMAALKAGNNAQSVMDAIESSPWAASRYGGTLVASC